VDVKIAIFDQYLAFTQKQVQFRVILTVEC